MKKNIIFLFITLLFLTLSGCDNKDDIEDRLTPDTSFRKDESEMFTARDNDESYDVNNGITVQLNGNSIACTSDKVRINGSTITIVDEGTFIISGSLDNGKIVVDADASDKPHLVLNEVSITNENFASLYISQADKVFVTLADGTTNKFINGGSFVTIDSNNVDGVVYSKQDLTFNGNGSLIISSPNGHGIVCKDDLVFVNGLFNINSNGHGLDVNDSIRIKNSKLSIVSNSDGIHCENVDDSTLGYVYIFNVDIEINASDDGISSSTLQIEDGTFNINAGLTYTSTNTSLKGLKTTLSMLINGGDFSINSNDDAVHSNSSIIVNDGDFEIITNDDGFHADETVQITGGTINVLDSYEGLEGLTINVSGGDISVIASDDGINAAGGADSSGFSNGRVPGMPPGGPGGGRPEDNFGGGNIPSGDGYIEISGGPIYIEALGDGIDSNGNLAILGGVVYVCGPTIGDTSVLDYDGTGIISGGEFYGTGANKMVQSLTGNDCGVLAVSVGNQSAGSTVLIKNSKGVIVSEFTPNLPYQIVIISNYEIVKGETYSILIDSILIKQTSIK